MRLVLLLLWLPLAAAGAGVDPENRRITLAIGSEPPSLDSSIAEDGGSREILAAINEGLVYLDQRLNVRPAVAERWDDRGEQVTFHLRKDARWADGSPVTAHDFVYAWRRLVDPKTGASGSLSLAWIVENAEEIIAGDLPPSALGVRALDDHTLVAEKSGPIPFFLEYIGTAPFYPLKQLFVEAQGEAYAAEADTLLSNGPFVLTRWVHGAELELAANPHYWNRDALKLDAVDIGYVTTDNRTLLNLFTSGELATFTLTAETLEDASEAGIRLRQNPMTGCIGLITFNFRDGRVTANKHLRKAIQASLDPETYANRIVAVPANTPASSMFPSWLGIDDIRLRDVHPPRAIEIDQAVARSHLERAAGELGEAPTLTLLSWEGQERQVEYIQGQLKSKLGLDVRIDKQSYKQAISRLIGGDFDISLSRFCGAVRDPDFFASIFHSDDTFNDGRFSSEEYDRLFERTRRSRDPRERMEAFGRLQEILIEEAVILPTHEIGEVYAQDDRLVGLPRFPIRRYARAAIR